MPDLLALRNDLDARKHTGQAIIKTPKGSHNKFAYDPNTRLLELHGLLPHGLMFPLISDSFRVRLAAMAIHST